MAEMYLVFVALDEAVESYETRQEAEDRAADLAGRYPGDEFFVFQKVASRLVQSDQH